MQLIALNFTDGTLDLRLDSSDLELLARTFTATTESDDTNPNHLQDMAILFTLGTVATRMYGAANTGEEVHAALQKAIARCGDAIGGKYDREGGGA